MTKPSVRKRFTESNDPGDLLDLRRDMIVEISAGALALGWIFITSAVGFGGNVANLLVALFLFAGGGAAILLRKRSFPAALYCLIGGLLGAAACNKYFFPEGWAQFFYPLAVVVSGLLVSNLSVFVIATLSSLLTMGVARVQGTVLLDPVQVWIPVLLIYLTAFASWLSSRQIHSVLGWMRSSYDQAREWLEQLRDERMAQARTIKILEEAYVRIEKLNYLLLEARTAAEEARRLKAEFAANISHELRTPLNLILGFSETMANAPETYTGAAWTPMLRGDVEEIYRSSRHLLSLIDDILDLSALEVHRLGLDLEEADIGKVVEEAAAVVAGLYQAKRLYLELDTQPGLPPILIDAVRIRQVLINLLSNASRFTPSGGVTITTRLVKDSIQVAVADTGIGIAPRDVPKVFQEFGQVDGSITRTHDGTGLGVPLSKRLVEMHGGVMWLESLPGSGTTFYFSLPWSYAAFKPTGSSLEMELQQAPAVRNPFRKCILVAETDPLLLRTLRRHLSAYDLVEVAQPDQAAGLVEKHCPIALILDEPLSSKEEVIKPWIAAVSPGLPLIRASFMGNLRAAREMGIQGYLVKPVSREHLLDSIADLPRQVHRILLVDDDPGLVDLFTRMLESTGSAFELFKGYSGEEALQILQSQPVDLVLLDMLLPGLNGMDVLRAVKNNPALAGLPVIMVSGQDPEGLVAANPLSLTLYRPDYASLTETIRYLEALLGVLPLPASPAPPEAAGAPPVS